jgi:hypothetical protein
VTVTSAQLRELTGELEELLARYRQAGAGDPQARRIQFWWQTQPSEMTFDPHDPSDDAEEA